MPIVYIVLTRYMCSLALFLFFCFCCCFVNVEFTNAYLRYDLIDKHSDRLGFFRSIPSRYTVSPVYCVNEELNIDIKNLAIRSAPAALRNSLKSIDSRNRSENEVKSIQYSRIEHGSTSNFFLILSLNPPKQCFTTKTVEKSNQIIFKEKKLETKQQRNQ